MTREEQSTSGRPRSRARNAGSWRPRWWVAGTSVVSFILGVATLVHEVLLTTGERPYVLLAGLVLLSGVPALVALDRIWR